MQAMSDDDEIKKFLTERGATICPPRPAAVLGETTPGWRRKVERRTEISPKQSRRDRFQKELETRQEANSLPFRKSLVRSRHPGCSE